MDTETSSTKKKVGIAFQGGSFLAGALSAGVVRALVRKRVFEEYDIVAFSGTSAGALVAAVCWQYALDDCIESAPDALEKQWLYNTSSLPLIPNQFVGDYYKLVTNLLQHNPIFYNIFELYYVPYMRQKFIEWIHQFIDTKKCVTQLYKKYTERRDYPRFSFGSADILKGTIVGFSDENLLQVLKEGVAKSQQIAGRSSVSDDDVQQGLDKGSEFLSKIIQASGSLDELNGLTTIAGKYEGTYIDGAWGQNPPVCDLVETGVDEIWVIETAFPKKRDRAPNNQEEREDRHEELLQNALVEHEKEKVDIVNEKLDLGLLINDLQTYKNSLDLIKSDPFKLSRLIEAFQHKYKDEYSPMPSDPDTIVQELLKKLSERKRRYVNVRFMRSPEIVAPLTAGARIITSPLFIREHFEIGEQMVSGFV